jgi:hypothetical protein
MDRPCGEPETAVLLYENTNAGIGNAKVFGDTFKSLGGQILADIGFGRDVNDCNPETLAECSQPETHWRVKLPVLYHRSLRTQ